MDVLRAYLYKSSLSKYPSPNYLSPQVYALGGRTLFGALTSPRMPTPFIGKWPIPIQEMEYYYNIAEKIMNFTQNYTKGASATQLILNRLQQGGIHDATDEPMAINLEPPSQFGVINSNPFFSSIIFLADAT